MKRILFSLLLVVFSVAVIAAPTEYYIGPYDSYSSSQSACNDHRNGSLSGDNWSVGYCGSVGGEYNGFQYVVDPDGYSNSKQYYTFYYLATCPDGTAANSETGLCEEPSDPCDQTDLQGDIWDSQTESCNCPDGQTDVFGSDASYVCRPELPECTPSSPGFTGYVNDQPVCNFNDQCGAGEQGGFIDGQWVCMPAACEGGTWVNGACLSPDDTNDQPGEEFGGGDQDGDGTPDAQDDDQDGDGVPNNDDHTPGDQGTARAEGGCGQPPVCTGDDPQACAILKQQWYTMCYDQPPSKVNSEISTGVQKIDQAFDSITGEVESFGSTGVGFSEAPGPFKQALLAYVPSGQPCVPMPINALGATVSIECEKINNFKLIFGWFLSVLTVVYIWHMAVKPVDK